MHTSFKAVLSVLGIASVFAMPNPAQAQFFNYNPYSYGRGFGYGNPFGTYYGREGGFLIGASSVIDASGQLQVTTQQAKLMQEQTKQEKLRTQRQAFDERRYEQMLTPTLEEQRRFDQHQELRRSQNDPPLTEIWSAKALNDLLKDLQKLQGQGGYASTMPLDQNVLKHINVTNGTTEGGNTKLIREGKTKWPLALKASSFESQRKQIDKLLPEAIQQAKGGEVDDDTLTSLIGAIKKLDKNLRSQVADISSTDYVRAKRYVSELESATKVLQDPNVANYFGKWAARGNDVSELVKHMTDNGLQFAPAGNGDQSFYTSLHRAMATYDVALSNQIRGPQMSATSQGRLLTPAPSRIE